MSYLHEFQDLEDRVEGNAYLTWRRFDRFLPGVDVLSIECHVGDIASREYKKLVFKGFAGQEMATIQLGKLVSMKEGGLSREQQQRYDELRGYFYVPELLAIFSDAIRDDNEERAKEIYAVAKRQLGHTQVMELMNMVQLIELSADLKRLEDSQADIPEQPRTADLKIPPSLGKISYDTVYDKTLGSIGATIQEIDAFLLSRL